MSAPERAPVALLARVARGCRWLAEAAGHFAAAVLLVLTGSIVLGIALRLVGIDNSWTYDLDLFSLVWVAFAGAVLTATRDHHVTAGIAVENMLGGRGAALSVLRLLIVGGFLVLFVISGWRQAHDSLVTHKSTLDTVQWPVWVAQAALPVGGALWIVAELGKCLRKLGFGGEETPPARDQASGSGKG